MLISAVTRRSISSRLGAFIATGVVLVFATRASAQSVCSSAPLAVQVLGSGGPSAGGTRASTGYLVWRGGRAVVMVDAGGGTFLRFGEAGARLQDLSLLAISHLHPDHVSDLPALLWLSELARQQSLKIAGPTGAGAFPSIDAFIRRLFDTSSGAFPILGGTLGQPGQGVRLDVVTVDATVGTSSRVWSDDDLEVSAIGVPHGNAPSIADALIMHFGLSARAPDLLARIHARPAAVGQIAQKAKAKRLVLSHFMQAPSTVRTHEWFSLFDPGEAIGEVRKHFSGRIDAAVDLQCIPIR